MVDEESAKKLSVHGFPCPGRSHFSPAPLLEDNEPMEIIDYDGGPSRTDELTFGTN